MSIQFSVGTKVRVRAAFPPGHVRTPYFVRGKEGVITGLAGIYANPEELAYGRAGMPALSLYRVKFRQADLWPDYRGSADDTAVVDVFEHWLEPTAKSQEKRP